MRRVRLGWEPWEAVPGALPTIPDGVVLGGGTPKIRSRVRARREAGSSGFRCYRRSLRVPNSTVVGFGVNGTPGLASAEPGVRYAWGGSSAAAARASVACTWASAMFRL